MPHRRRQFQNKDVHHITLRRMADKILFQNIDDYYRGIFSIYEFNTTRPIIISDRRKIRKQIKKSGLETVDMRDKLVEILAFCLMPNHIHLLLNQLKDNGISKFMLKLGSGYATYFLDKYSSGNRIKGHFFQDRFNAVHIADDAHLKVAFVYVHTNPIAMIEPHWKEKGIGNPKKAIDFIEKYKWSSYSDYLDKKNFPSVTEREDVLKIMGGVQGCREAVNDWVFQKGEMKKLINKFDRLIK